MYGYTNINTFLQRHTGFVDFNADKKEHIFNLYFDLLAYRIVVVMAKDYELDLSVGGFAYLLGFDKKVLKDGTNFMGDRISNITRDLDWVFIHCDVITRQATDVPSDVFYSLSTAGLLVSSSFKKEPLRLKFHPVNEKRIDGVGLRITDGRNNILDLNGADVAVDLVPTLE